jgi:hypothetical protein
MLLTGPATRGAGRANLDDTRNEDRDDAVTTTPIKPLIVIFDENNSFDQYLWVYPVATNPPGEPAFFARPDTPTVNGLTTTLIAGNPNPEAPFRLDRSHAATCDNDNHYRDEQLACLGWWQAPCLPKTRSAITGSSPSSSCSCRCSGPIVVLVRSPATGNAVPDLRTPNP